MEVQYCRVVGIGVILILAICQISQGQDPQGATYEVTPDYLPGFTYVSIEVDRGDIPNSVHSVCAVQVDRSPGRSEPEYFYGSGPPVTRLDCCVEMITGESVDLQLFVDYANELINIPSAQKSGLTFDECGVQDLSTTVGPGEYYVAFRSFKDENLAIINREDRVYQLRFRLDSVTPANPVLDPGIPIVLQIPESRIKTITQVTGVTLIAVDQGTDQERLMFNLDDGACYKATFTVDPYIDGENFAGFRLHTCYLTPDGNTFQQIPFIGANGCTDDRYSGKIPGNVGFVKDETQSGQVGTLLTYTARFPCFDVFKFLNSRKVILTCSADFCFDASNTGTLGSCGGQHCDPFASRVRRSATSTVSTSTVSTTINRLPAADEEPAEPLPCSDTLVFKGTVGGLGSIATALLVLIVYQCLDLRGLKRRTRQNKKSAAKGDNFLVNQVGSTQKVKF